MNQTVLLKASKLPKVLGELAHSIQFLKVFSLSALGVSLLLTMTLALLVRRPPVILTLQPSAIPLDRVDAPRAVDQVRAAVARYIEKRYGWEPSTVSARLKEAQAFILPQSLKAFQGALAEVSRFSSERQVSQKAYPVDIRVDLAQRTVFVTGDRVTSIQGLKAAGDLKLALSFEDGPHTPENPWGVYITKEREEP